MEQRKNCEQTSPSKHLSWWRRPEDVFSVTFFCLPRRLQDITARCLLEDVLKTPWRRPLEEAVLQTHLEDVVQGVLKTSSRSLGRQKNCHADILEDEKLLHWRRLEDVLNTSWKTRNVCWSTKIYLTNLRV